MNELARVRVFVGCNPDSVDVALCAVGVCLGSTQDLGDTISIDVHADPLVRIFTLSNN